MIALSGGIVQSSFTLRPLNVIMRPTRAAGGLGLEVHCPRLVRIPAYRRAPNGFELGDTAALRTVGGGTSAGGGRGQFSGGEEFGPFEGDPFGFTAGGFTGVYDGQVSATAFGDDFGAQSEGVGDEEGGGDGEADPQARTEYDYADEFDEVEEDQCGEYPAAATVAPHPRPFGLERLADCR